MNPFNMQQPMPTVAPQQAPVFNPSAYQAPVYPGYVPQVNTTPVAPTSDAVATDATVTKEVTV
jgi:hypothetical protein